jgi:hypothetical protein
VNLFNQHVTGMTINISSICMLALLGIASAKVCPVIDLKSAERFSILGGSAVANTGASQVSGDVGIAPGTAITGFTAGVLAAGFGTFPAAVVLPVKADLGAAILQSSALANAGYFLGGTIDLGGRLLMPGYYFVTTTLGVLRDDLRLDARGDETGTFLFNMVSPQSLNPNP